MKRLVTLLCIACAAIHASAEEVSVVKPLITWLFANEEQLDAIPFADVVAAVSGKRVLAMDLADPVDQEVFQGIHAAVDATLAAFENTTHPVHQVGRINEVSRFFENACLEEIDGIDGLSAGIPVNAAGNEQRSGYPDIRIEHESSGRLYYLDPKVYRADSENSGFRTFYFEPQMRTNKITEDACHLILGIAHNNRDAEGRWDFSGWKLIDLHAFEIGLKAEFQASNRDLYRGSGHVVGRSE